MNYIIFLSVGMFVALFLVVSSHFGVPPKSYEDFSPKKVAAVIRAEHRQNVMIAQQKYDFEVRPSQIAENPDASQPILPASNPEDTSDKKQPHEKTGLFSSNGFVQLIKETADRLFSQDK